MSEEMIQEFELTIEQARANVELGDALDRLNKNKDFKLVFVEGLLKDEAVRLVHLKAHPAMQRDDMQSKLDAMIDMIGNLEQYLVSTEVQANESRQAMADAEEALVEIAQGGQ